jgi:hypothetical protein
MTSQMPAQKAHRAKIIEIVLDGCERIELTVGINFSNTKAVLISVFSYSNEHAFWFLTK